MVYTQEFIQAINDWQLGAKNIDEKRKLAERLESFTLPNNLKSCEIACYRSALFATKNRGLSIIFVGVNERIDMEISSWTVDYDIAKDIKPIPNPDNGEIRFIVKIIPEQSDIIINLNELYLDDCFLSACDKYKNLISGYSSGIGCFGNSEKEIVLKSIVSIEDIFAWGSHHSSDRETLMKLYYFQYFNKSEQEITDDDRIQFDKLLTDYMMGPQWNDNRESVLRITRMLKEKSKYFYLLHQKYPDFFRL